MEQTGGMIRLPSDLPYLTITAGRAHTVHSSVLMTVTSTRKRKTPIIGNKVGEERFGAGKFNQKFSKTILY